MKRTTLFVAVALFAGTLGHEAHANRGSERPTRSLPASRTVGRQERADTARYWTRARMKAAVPYPLGIVGDLEDHPAPASSTGAARPGPIVGTLAEAPTVHLVTEGSSDADEEVLAEPTIAFERYQIDSPSLDPYRAHGKVFFFDPSTGSNYVCSGTAVDSANASVVLTAGHCAHGGGSGETWFTNWIFVPAYQDGSAPYGRWGAQQMFALEAWAESASLARDVAAIVVAPDSEGRRLTEVVGGRGVAWDLGMEVDVEAFGYPAASPFDGRKLIACSSAVGMYTAAMGSPYPLGIGCDMTPGSSGGGWVVGGRVNSVVSFGYTSLPGVLWGPYFDGVVAALYERAQEVAVAGVSPSPTPTPTESASPSPSESPLPSPTASQSPTPSPTPVVSPEPEPTPTHEPTPEASPTPPGEPDPVVTAHEVKVRVSLRKHLVAGGEVIPVDGFGPCSIERRIRVLRRTATGWKRVGSSWTRQDGSYRVTLGDRPGRYRVKVPTARAGDTDTCSAARSDLERHGH